MSTKQYRPSSRSWIKLWVNEWLTSTVRWQLTPQQRSIWVDLLALAGRSRFPGIICSGETKGVLDPFPMDYLCSVFRCAEPDVQAAFGLFVSQDRIIISESGVIKIVNWDKFQSEYQQKRQRSTYKQNAAKSISNVRKKSSVEVEGEVEVEVEGEGETPNASNDAFNVFWNSYPRKVGHKKALQMWAKMSIKEQDLAIYGLRLWRQTEQWQRDSGKFVPYASTFLAQRRWEDEAWKGCFDEKQE